MEKAKRMLSFSSENSNNLPGIIMFTMINKDNFSERMISLENGKKMLIHKEAKGAFMKHEIKYDNLVFNAEGLASGHAVLAFEKGQFYINDLFSNTGTYLDGIKLKPNSRCLLYSGQEVNFGHGIAAKIKILSPHNSEKNAIKPPLALLGNETKCNVQNDKEESPKQIPSVTSAKGKHYQ